MLAISEVSICNAALIKLGAETITSLSEDTKNARLCDLRYPFIRNAVLESHPWAFATKTMELASVDGVEYEDWNYAFQKPADFLCMIRGEDWDEEFDTFSEYLVANSEPFNIKYIAEVTDVGRYTYSFAECVSWRLASDLAYALTNSNSVVEQMFRGWELALKQARYHDAHKKSPEGLYANSWINIRG